jgi:hypothetical protein
VSPKLVQALTFVAAGVVVVLYVLFFRWRYRIEQRGKLPSAPPVVVPDAPALAATAPTPARPIPRPEPDPAEPPAPKTVAGLVAGIRLPADLVPLLTFPPRPDVADCVAFWTKGVPAEAVANALTAELERLGYIVTPAGDVLRADRGTDTLVGHVHATPALVNMGGRPAFPTVPEGAVVVEVWVP